MWRPAMVSEFIARGASIVALSGATLSPYFRIRWRDCRDGCLLGAVVEHRVWIAQLHPYYLPFGVDGVCFLDHAYCEFK